MRVSAFSPSVFAAALCASLLPFGPAGLAMRGGVVVALIPALALLGRSRLGERERQWLATVGLFLFAQIVASILQLAMGETVDAQQFTITADLARQSFMAGTAFLLVIALRRANARARLSAGMTLLGLLAASVILVTFVLAKSAGLQSGREIKLYASQSLGIPLNPLAAVTLYATLLGYGHWGQRTLLRISLPVVASVAIVASDARSAITAGAAAVLLLALLGSARKIPSDAQPVVAFVVGALVLLGIAFLILMEPLAAAFDVARLSEVTTGRYDLWVAAARRFLEKPVTGWGAGSWYHGLLDYLPGYSRWGDESLAEGIGSGGYHNAYLGLLADKGLLVGAAGLVMIGAIGSAAREVFKRRRELEVVDRRIATLAPALMLLSIVRSLFESPGLFGQANGLVDFLEYCCAAVFIAMAGSLRGTGRIEPRLSQVGGNSKVAPS